MIGQIGDSRRAVSHRDRIHPWTHPFLALTPTSRNRHYPPICRLKPWLSAEALGVGNPINNTVYGGLARDDVRCSLFKSVTWDLVRRASGGWARRVDLSLVYCRSARSR